MPLELYRDPQHVCLMFSDLVHASEAAVQANQFLVVDHGVGALIDPGGNIAFNELFLGMGRHFPPQRLAYLLASHADPDIIASLDRWMTATPDAKLYVSTLWERFVPHFCKPGKTTGRVVGIPDGGMRLTVGRRELIALPAHFMHAEGNFQFYDPTARILFSGDLGVSLVSGEEALKPIASLSPLPRGMEGFHRRYMVSNKVLRCWARMVRELDIDMIVPQHGSPLVGDAVPQFIAWAEGLSCGIDLMNDTHYRVPA
jgi:flavorubredoxin